MILLHGDCLKQLKRIPNSSVDLVLTDLPYGCTDCKWDSAIPLDELWSEYKRIIKPGSPVVLFGNLRFGMRLIDSNPQWFRYEHVWQKSRGNNWLDCNKRPLTNHEYVYVFCEHMPLYNPQKQPGKPYVKREIRKSFSPVYHTKANPVSINEDGSRCPLTCMAWDFAKNERGQHNTQKPTALLAYLIRTYSNPGDIILDNTMGSGSTGVACLQTGRDFIGIEKDFNIFNVAESRIYYGNV